MLKSIVENRAVGAGILRARGTTHAIGIDDHRDVGIQTCMHERLVVPGFEPRPPTVAAVPTATETKAKA